MRERIRITEFTVPGLAGAGNSVPVTVTVENKWIAAVGIAVVGVRDTVDRFINWEETTLEVDQSVQFTGSFTMPTSAAIVNIYIYYLGEDGYWHLDDEAEAPVGLSGVVFDLSSMIAMVMIVMMMGMVIKTVGGQ